MRITLFIALIFTSMISCKSTDQKEVPAVKETKTNYNCYLAVLANDSISMKITVKDMMVEGELHYNFYEKDKTHGNISGMIKGDTLFANYTFMSEGVTSTREVVFLLKGNDWVEGYGEMDAATGTKFVNPAALDFTGKTILKEINCN